MQNVAKSQELAVDVPIASHPGQSATDRGRVCPKLYVYVMYVQYVYTVHLCIYHVYHVM